MGLDSTAIVPSVGLSSPANKTQQSRFATTAFTDDRHHFSFVRVEVEISQHLVVAEPFTDREHTKKRRESACVRCRRGFRRLYEYVLVRHAGSSDSNAGAIAPVRGSLCRLLLLFPNDAGVERSGVVPLLAILGAFHHRRCDAVLRIR
jgi:hypothetical protein